MSAARRRRKALERATLAQEYDVRWAFRLDRLPRLAVRVSSCSCGRSAWLMPGATAEDHADFDQDEADHQVLCAELDEPFVAPWSDPDHDVLGDVLEAVAR